MDQPTHQELELAPSPRTAPGPRAWPIIGDPAILRGARNPLQVLEGHWHRYGDVFRLRIFGQSTLIVSHPEAIKHVLRSNRTNYVKGVAYDGLRRLMGGSLLTLEGEVWKERRSLIQPSFHRRSLENLTNNILESGSRVWDDLAQRCAGASLEIDAHREMVRLTLDVVTNALFGQLLHESAVPIDVLTSALEIVSEGANGVPLPEWVPTPYNIKLGRTVRALDELVYRIIRTARSRPRGDGSLLSMLLEARDQDGAPLSDKAVRDEVLTMFIAGHETTALALTWLFVLLDGAPHVLARMQHEVQQVLGGREPTYDDVSKLTYMRQVIDETLRMRPPGPYIPRNAVDDDEICGYRVHAGEMVMLFIWATHRHSDYWTKPLTFDPDRFGRDNERRDSWSYLPFSAGPRTCIGNMFSILEASLLLAQMLARFEVTVDQCAHVKPVAIGTVRPSDIVRVRLAPKSGTLRRLR